MRELSEAGVEFVRERHIGTLSTMARWGGIHSVPVGFTFDGGVLRIITSRDSQKVRNILRDGTATVSQVDGARWLAFPARATVHDDPEEVARAVELYARRYRQPRVNPSRVAIQLVPERLMGSSGLLRAA
ncbi:F420-dependent biliverdin reductase [Microbacterium yannicii]|uniref:F420-dependent biliverdin reductase n=1 Tax=Microbacterium yannicii TaxID=671622 RepID=A0ABP9MDR4_9MICO|nr:TIGR03618 family F420-dependent PPOX class oxidoreductase [Microbacterium yannicii]MCO5952539.1 TIGR03618 family F420-dependent PPOX class oxidoreductase [Microbacterium yannicii]